MVRVDGITRSAFIARGAIAAGAVYGAGAVAPIVQRALAAEPAGDTAILDFALTLESIEVAFTQEALKVKGLSGDVKRALEEIAEHERAHQQQLKRTLEQLGATASPAPRTAFPGLGGQDAMLSLAIRLEEIGLGALSGAAPLIQSADVLQAAGSIAQVEARHAGALRELAGEDPAPDAFDKALSRAEAMKRVRPFVRGGA